jgi:hypothetical protein
MDREGIRAISRDCLEDGIGAFGPDERVGIGIVDLNESGDVGLEFLQLRWTPRLICLSASRASQRST